MVKRLRPGTNATTGIKKQSQAEIKLGDTKIDAALEVASDCGGIDGDHHKMWVIDQMVRHLTGIDYDEWVTRQKAGEDGPETYEWDEGIAP